MSTGSHSSSNQVSSSSESRVVSPTQSHPPHSKLSSSAARRSALRDFYKLSASASESGTGTGAGTGTRINDNIPEDGEKEYEDYEELEKGGIGAMLDKLQLEYNNKKKKNKEEEDDDKNEQQQQNSMESITLAVDQLIRDLIQKNDLKTLLHYENQLVSEIKTLDSEQKALVYNNYSKLTAASTTLGAISDNNNNNNQEQSKLENNNHDGDDDDDDSKNVKKIETLMDPNKRKIIENSIEGIKKLEGKEEPVKGKGKGKDNNNKNHEDLVKTAQWLLNVSSELENLVFQISELENNKGETETGTGTGVQLESKSESESGSESLITNKSTNTEVSSSSSTTTIVESSSKPLPETPNDENNNNIITIKKLRDRGLLIQSKAIQVLEFFIKQSSPTSSSSSSSKFSLSSSKKPKYQFDLIELNSLKTEIESIKI